MSARLVSRGAQSPSLPPSLPLPGDRSSKGGKLAASKLATSKLAKLTKLAQLAELASVCWPSRSHRAAHLEPAGRASSQTSGPSAFGSLRSSFKIALALRASGCLSF